MDITIHIDDDKVASLESYRLTQRTTRPGPERRGITTYHYADITEMVTKMVEEMVTAVHADETKKKNKQNE